MTPKYVIQTSKHCGFLMIGIPSDKFMIIGPSEDALWDYYGINIKNIESSVTSILKQLA